MYPKINAASGALRLVKLTVCLAILFLTSCNNDDFVVIEGPAKLLARPYPYTYPSTGAAQIRSSRH